MEDDKPKKKLTPEDLVVGKIYTKEEMAEIFSVPVEEIERGGIIVSQKKENKN